MIVECTCKNATYVHNCDDDDDDDNNNNSNNNNNVGTKCFMSV